MKIWILLTIFITGCVPVSTHYQNTNTATIPSPLDFCKLQKKAEISDAITTKFSQDKNTSLNHYSITSSTFNNTGNSFLNLPLDLQYNSEKNITLLAAIASEINAQLKKLNEEKKDKPQERKDDDSLEQFKKLLLASIPFFLFLWGLINYRTSEARAKVAMLTPLLEKASEAIKTASEKFNSYGLINENDLQEFTIPMLNLERALRDTTATDYIIEQNKDAFKSIRALLPAKVIIEVKNRDLISKLQYSLTTTLMNHTYINQTIADLAHDYDFIAKKLLVKKRSYFNFTKLIFYVIFSVFLIGLFSIYLLAVVL